MTTTTQPRVTYRKTKSGEWVAFGPADRVIANSVVTVTKKSGDIKTERIARVGRTFRVDGREMVYGYIDREDRTARTGSRSSRPMCEACNERRAVTTARDMSGLVGDTCGMCLRDGGLSFA